MNNSTPIDIVVTWVDNKDPAWLEKKAKYTGTDFKEGNTDIRYRDWDTLKYWFRGVEKFAPWVRNVYFVTDDQKPEWLNLDHPKLKWVRHTDFIPEEYLPTFNSNAIEWNLHRIEGLSDNFVYFNDDVFLINNTKPEDFFCNELPCDLPNLGILYPNGFFSHSIFNNIDLLNRHFSLKESVKKNLDKWIKHQSIKGVLKLILYARDDLIPGSFGYHIHTNFNKETYKKLLEKEKYSIEETVRNRLRTKNDITLYCIRDWQIFSGKFHPKKPIGKSFHTATMSYSNDAINYLKKQKGKVICLNDSEDEVDFETHKKMIIQEFEKILPNKSSFEI